MNFKKPLYQVPVPSTEFEGGGAYLCGDTIRFEYYRDGILYRSGIRFHRVPAARTRAERCCKSWHIEAYDTLVEVEKSSWVEEIRAETSERWRNEWETHHYMIYLDSSGCFEIIAARLGSYSRGSRLMVKDLSDLSRAVSHALRHEPWLYELELDEEGWASVESILVAFRKERSEWVDLGEADLAGMIESSSKRRHEIKDGRIRAVYGHSLAGKLKRTPATPPDVLYHGTAPDVVPLIVSSGLLPMGRQYVHLSVDEATAAEVGRRKARKPTILRVRAAEANAKGVRFYEGNEKVWLAEAVPAEFIAFYD